MKKFKLKSHSTSKSNYQTNILDIWCQNDKIVAYIEGTNIYKTEMIIKNNRIDSYYCSCPSSEEGMNFCKHLSSVENYLKNNEILELEYIEPKEEKLDFSLSTNQILVRFKNGINKFLDDDNNINCYQSNPFGDYIFKYCIYIDKFLDNQDPEKAFDLVTNYIKCLDKIYIYNEDIQEDINEILINYLVTLATDFNYLDNIKEFLQNKYRNQELDTLGEEIIDNIIPTIKTKEYAINYVQLLKQIETKSYQEEKIEDYLRLLNGVK